MSESRPRVSLFGLAPAAGLLVLLVGVGAVAMYAESQRDWGSYFLMERAMAVGASVAVPLLALALVGGFALVAVAPRFER